MKLVEKASGQPYKKERHTEIDRRIRKALMQMLDTVQYTKKHERATTSPRK